MVFAREDRLRRRVHVDHLLLACGVLASFALAARGSVQQVSLIAGGLCGLLAVRWVTTHLRTALLIVIVFLPVQQAVLAYLYALGLPAGVTRNLGFVKEAVCVGVVVAALRSWDDRAKLRPADWLAVSFLAMAAIYAVMPLLLPGILGRADLAAVISALRVNCLFIVLFLACRRLPWSSRDGWVLATGVGVATTLLAIGAFWERFANASFVRISNDVLHIDVYRTEVLKQPNVPARFVSGVTNVGGQVSFRIGSWFYDYLGFGFYLILPLALTCCLMARSRLTFAACAPTAVVASTLILTLGRSSIVGGFVAIGLILAAASHFRLPNTARMVLLFSAGLLLLLPLAGGSELTRRVFGAFNGTDNSTSDHTSRSVEGLNHVIQHPWGAGLGSNLVTAVRHSTGTGILPENIYLQIGTEMGAISMLLFVAFILATQRDLRRIMSFEPRVGLATAVWAAGWGLAFNGLLLEVWLSLPTALTFWALAGVITSNRQHDDGYGEHPERVDRAAQPQLRPRRTWRELPTRPLESPPMPSR